MKQPILSVRNLKVYFPVEEGFLKKSSLTVKAVDDISFDVYEGESVGLVGESGSGKTTVSRSILGLVDEAYHFKESKIFYEGKNILEMTREELKTVRRNVQMIFQDPYSSLNPRMTVGKIIEESLYINGIGDRKERTEKARDIMQMVGLNPDYYNRYPHEFSGGQRQRVGIARSLILRPRIIISDEPVSALDVSIQVQILKLMEELRKELKLTFLFVAHDLAIVDYFCQRIIVMYLGKIMETGTNDQIVKNSAHPYTRALLSAVPIPNPNAKKNQTILSGDIPSPINPPQGCVFHTRCPERFELCDKETPPEVKMNSGHTCFCWLYAKEKANRAV